METEGSASKAAATSNPTGASPAVSASNGATAGIPDVGSPLTREELLRERYLKGVRKRKCAVCGNTARARCPFRACKTCCLKAKNHCDVHVTKPKQVSSPPVLDPHDPRWAATVNGMPTPYGIPYIRPGYIPPGAAYHAAQAQMGAYRVGYYTPQSGPRPPGPTYVAQNARPYAPSAASLEQQELQRLKNLKAAMQAANREAMISSSWRSQKMREYLDGELVTEDEAFDRYQLNMALLEEVFLPKTAVPSGISADGELLVKDGESQKDNDETDASDSLMVVDGLRVRRGMNGNRKEASRIRLKRTVERGLQLLKRGEQDVEDFMEDEDQMQVGLQGRRRDLKRYKASKEGKECWKRIDLFETLLQKTGQIHSKSDINSCGEMYRQSFGQGLDLLLPHLTGNIENLLGAKVREDSETMATHAESGAGGEENCFPSDDLDHMLYAPEAAKEGGMSSMESTGAEGSGAEVDKVLREEESRSQPSTMNGTAVADEANGNTVSEEIGSGKVKNQVLCNWPRLHQGFLAGRGWWKVEVDEQGAQLVCEHFLNSTQALQVL